MSAFEFGFAPIEEENLPEYTSVAEFNLGPETLASTAEGPVEGKFMPTSPQERLELVRHYVGMIAGAEAQLVADEFLINDREEHRVTHLSVGTLPTGDTIVVATDDNPELVADADREQSTNLADEADDQLLTGDALDAALESLGEHGRGFMIASGLAVDGAVHMARNPHGKDVWVTLPGMQGGRDDAQLAA